MVERPDSKASDQHQPEEMNAGRPAVHPLYLPVQPVSPKGAAHHRRLPVYAATTFKYVFDYHPGDIYWCTADVGWGDRPQLSAVRSAGLRRHPR